MGADGRGRRTRWIAVTGGVLAVVVASTVAYRTVFADGGGSATSPVQVAEGFPAVLPPSLDGPPSAPAPAASLSPSSSRPAGRSAAPAAKGITDYSACTSGSTVTFTATYGESFGYRHVFIDTDSNASTGYQVLEAADGFGADFMIENDVLYASTGTGWTWREIRGISPLLSVTGGTYRWRVESVYGTGRVVLNGSGGERTEERYTPVLPVEPC